jgi:hypothetical protein
VRCKPGGLPGSLVARTRNEPRVARTPIGSGRLQHVEPSLPIAIAVSAPRRCRQGTIDAAISRTCCSGLDRPQRLNCVTEQSAEAALRSENPPEGLVRAPGGIVASDHPRNHEPLACVNWFIRPDCKSGACLLRRINSGRPERRDQGRQP